MAGKKSASRRTEFKVDNPFEALMSIGKGVTDSLKNDVVKGGKDDLFEQLIKMNMGEGAKSEKKPSAPKKGDLKAGEALILGGKSEKKVRSEAAPAMDYHREIAQSGERAASRESRQTEQRVQQIMNELQRLVSSTQVLESQFKDIAAPHASPVKAGKYHENFFDWMLNVIQQARMKVEDSGAWMSAMKGKGKGKKSFMQDMWKKSNTSVTMSNERAVQTQTG